MQNILETLDIVEKNAKEKRVLNKTEQAFKIIENY